MSRTRTERLVNLVICLLSTRRFLTAAQIAATVPGYEHDPTDARDHEAFQRKFERDKAELRDLGVPLETGTASAFDTEPGYRIAHREYALPDILLEPDEAAAVGIAARLWQHAGLAAAASSGLAKLRAAGVDVDPHATFGVEPVVTVDPAFAALTAAARDRRVVVFEYRVPSGDGPTQRRLQPWGVVCWRGRWYVVGHDLDRAATRCFRLSRVVGTVRVTGRPGAYSVPTDIDLISHVARWSGPVERTGVATVLARHGRAAGLRRWAESCDPSPDGDRLTLRYAEPETLAANLAGYGADIRVVDPPEVREMVIQRLKEIAAAHEPAAASGSAASPPAPIVPPAPPSPAPTVPAAPITGPVPS
ncbi:WYL domain-containing protein [Solwaraspora sp. WMMD406]|uniref:helix-turn-helix transcriptional regulator n=1 Tax=Solwaraspora sp. WMMD406 TaxID=3016095 RepID=UPI0024172090|nr:WYL domain-containing protein [Solwaraspora sp. WMMD406]MDG4766220.1 WYL domain-containing protein [Solwaraspora sp. WMMD406]